VYSARHLRSFWRNIDKFLPGYRFPYPKNVNFIFTAVKISNMAKARKDLGQNCRKNLFPHSNIFRNLRISMHRGKNYSLRVPPAKADKYSNPDI